MQINPGTSSFHRVAALVTTNIQVLPMYIVMHLSMEPAYYQSLGISGIGSGFILQNELVNRPKTLLVIDKKCVFTKPPDLGTLPMIYLLFFVSQNMSVHFSRCHILRFFINRLIRL
jgi:hypothetical protein